MSQTLQKLAEITDAAAFENLATSVLREANSDYERLIQSGVNADGKTIKGPLDGVCFIKGSHPPKMLAVHHSTVNRNKIENKWLHDPSKVKHRKKNPHKAPAGDILKTLEIFNEEKQKTSDLEGLLILTATSDPEEKVVRLAESIARDGGLELDIWSASRIAHFLDIDPNGQYLRSKYFGIGPERLSRQLMFDLSLKSIKQFPMYDNDKDCWVESSLDRSLQDISVQRGVSLILGDSGIGKTTSCYKYVLEHVKNGGCSLYLTHEMISNSNTLESALNKGIKELSTNIYDDMDNTPLSYGLEHLPFLIVVEDVNRSRDTLSILEKLSKWHKQRDQNEHWLLLCPLYPKYFTSLDQRAVEILRPNTLYCDGLSIAASCEYIKNRYNAKNISITDLEAKKIVSELGTDPLLLSLYDVESNPSVSEVIRNHICKNLDILSGADDYMTEDLLRCLVKLFYNMYQSKITEFAWSEVLNQGIPDYELKILRVILKQGKILKLVGEIGNQKVQIRHDRIQRWLVVESFKEQINTKAGLDLDIIKEPYYAEEIGLTLSSMLENENFIIQVKENNPLALIYALKNVVLNDEDKANLIKKHIEDLFDNEDIKNPENNHLRLQCLNCLAQIDSKIVLEILNLFENEDWAYLQAGFRNGDINMGIMLCLRINPGIKFSELEEVIQHSVTKFGQQFTETIIKLAKVSSLNKATKTGILRLIGYIGDHKLADSISKFWKHTNESDKVELLEEFLWAATHCCGNKPNIILDPIMEVWNNMSDIKEGSRPISQKAEVVYNHYKFAFRRYVPVNALNYLIEQSKKFNSLETLIIYLMHGVNHPIAIEFVVKILANKARDKGKGVSFFMLNPANEWEKKDANDLRIMSNECIETLLNFWTNREEEENLRFMAFRFWATQSSLLNISLLKEFQNDKILSDVILIQRVKLKDKSAYTLLADRIVKSNGDSYWWQYARRIASDNVFIPLIENEISQIKEGDQKDNVWIISELLMELTPDIAEPIFLKYWDKIKACSNYLQSALFCATDNLCQKVADVVKSHDNPSSLFANIVINYGFYTNGKKSITKKYQLEALLPYLEYFNDQEIYCLYRICNKHNWLYLRKKHFDVILVKSSDLRYSQYLSIEKSFEALDEMQDNGGEIRAYHWAEGYLENDGTVDELINTVLCWLNKKKEKDKLAIHIATSIISSFGSRGHFKQLMDTCIEVEKEYSSYFKNVLYFVQRNKLS